MSDEAEVTPAMIAAGYIVFKKRRPFFRITALVKEIYREMEHVRQLEKAKQLS